MHTARAPFNTAKADIVIRSSDNVYFRVFRCLLALASPFFDAMFDLPRPLTEIPDYETYDGLEVIPMTEGSRTIDMMLRFCYPVPSVGSPRLDNLTDIENLLEAAIKYSMDGIEKKASEALISRHLLEKEPLRVFAIAYRYRLEREARIAARYTLHKSPFPLDSPELRYIPPQDRLKLAEYRKKSSAAIRYLTTSLEWIKRSETHQFYEWWTSCCQCRSKCDVRYLLHSTYAREWWAEYMEESTTALQERPCGQVVSEPLTKALERANECPACRRRAYTQMMEFTTRFADEIEKTITEVSGCFHPS
ncbi:hypothetical protein SERLA73DRAFT_57941 [Serpula lacrymans var. lacrymans S7.3]|uniref:BTB domain-containing protein n=2 Tax=Serpula lacrymans var. lacrymans TaxID=341189 RepID=F8Q4D9_SERL3|nr:uncharacterized protein SERLADRAFT_440602 [Serpula lacrymans var. lacrymans S7.9]EGN96994.1 hypothetical protein SERLA73DRAFT_57941 [Serpula lacrymans var. lacrymans S7.3]EGO22585.1 hypothetical protein SERLADRAFT_440602 [Serpula lacrymans var. lacrymans S7.9]